MRVELCVKLKCFNMSQRTGGLGTFFQNLFHKWSGSALTDAEEQANAFNAAEAQKQREWEQQMSNTAYQRQVSDMKAAGINPMLAVGGSGASIPSGASASSVTPSTGGLDFSTFVSAMLGLKQFNLSKVIAKEQLKNMEKQREVMDAEKAEKLANAAEKTEGARGSKLSNDFFERMQQVREESERLANELTRKRGREVDANIDKLKSGKALDEELSKTEGSKRNLYVSRELLNNATAENIVAMRPYLQAELSARSEAERAAAKVSAVDAAYRNGLISAGAIEAAVRETNANATEMEASAKVAEIEKELKGLSLAMKSGDFSLYTSGEKNALMDALYQGLSLTSQAILGK